MKNILEKDLREKPKQEYYSECICGTECRGFVNVKCKELKQEIIEEVAKDFYPNENELMERIAFKRGYAECKERMYSEEEVKELILQFNNDKPGTYDASNWFDQFKNKKI